MSRGLPRSFLVVLVALLLGGAVAAVLWGPQLARRFGIGARTEDETLVEVSPELADSTLSRFESFQSGRGDQELRLSSAELSSVVRYSLPGFLPAGVNEPSVVLQDSVVVLKARLAVASLPDLPALRDIVALLPDTIQVELGGRLIPLGDQAALKVDRVEASRVPIPPRLVPEILKALGRTETAGLPPDALAVPLPRGLRAAYVRSDTLVLVAERP
jgi:hypothetical protein